MASQKHNLLDTLIDDLHSTEGDIREAAARELGELGDAKAVLPLLQRVDDYYPEIRMSALTSLNRLGGELLCRLVREARHTDEEALAETLVEIVSTRRDPQVIQSLIWALTHDTNVLQSAAVRVLGIIGAHQAVEPLSRLLRTGTRSLRGHAIRALSQIGDDRATAGLLISLHDRSPHNRQQAAHALGTLGNPEAIPALTQALWDQEAEVAHEAGTALATLGSQAIPPLLKILTEIPERIVRQRAVSTLDAMHWQPHNAVEHTVYLMAKEEIHCVYFGTGIHRHAGMLCNPDVSTTTVPMPCLAQIVIDADTFHFHALERFLTYAINQLGQPYLKKHVTVHVYGDSEKLPPNLRNNLTTLCKHFYIHAQGEGWGQ